MTLTAALRPPKVPKPHRPLTAAQKKVAYYGPDPSARQDADVAAKWNQGALSPRQSAGFYEVLPERFPALMARYRARVKAIEAAARWRRKSPAPDGKHTGIGWGKVGSFREIRQGGYSAPWGAWHSEHYAWSQLSPAKQRKAIEPAPPKGDQELTHDASYQFSSRLPLCPACDGFVAERDAWFNARSIAYHKLGIDIEKQRGGYTGSDPAQWPDGSWSGDYNYPPMPIRSARAVKRTPPIE